MRALIGSKECAVEPGSLLSELVAVYEEKLAKDPMIKAIRGKTGQSHLIFIINGRVVRPEQYRKVRLKKGDDVRIQHPYFGG
jgi:sulfur carrier protein ThiS